MDFPHDLVLTARASDLEDPCVLAHYAELLLGGRPSLDAKSPEILKGWLQELPPAEAMQKIARRLTRMARAHEAPLRDFRWWDIILKQRALLAVVRRDGRDISIGFFWKKPGKKALTTPYSSQSPPAYDPRALNGWRIEIEGDTYGKMIAEFALWLKLPFKFPISGK